MLSTYIGLDDDGEKREGRNRVLKKKSFKKFAQIFWFQNYSTSTNNMLLFLFNIPSYYMYLVLEDLL